MSLPVVLTLMGLLIVKHTLADYVLQTSGMLSDRHVYLHPGRLSHVAVHAVGTALAFLLVSAPWLVAGGLALADAIAHFHIDWAKGTASHRLNPDINSARYWQLHGFDQMFHLLTYVLLVLAWTQMGGNAL